jgi:hypothetical protein
VSPFHTAEEMRENSDLAHHIAGSVLAVASILAVAAVAGVVDPRLWAGLLALFGVVFVLYLIVHHGFENVRRNWRYIRNDPQQRQHLALGALIAAGAIAEIMGAPFAFALALAAVGTLFILHPQHGTHEAARRARRAHAWLGSLLLLAAVGRAIAIPQTGWGAAAWALPLLVAALVLIRYQEPAGAYEADHAQ